MKTKHITGGKVEILLVEGLAQGQRPTDINSEIGYDWQFLSTIDNLTGSEADMLVRKVPLGYWLDYVNPRKRYDYMCSTPKESLLSLLQSNGVLFENPLGDYSEALKRHIVTGTWDAYQSNVFNPKTTLIFVKQ